MAGTERIDQILSGTYENLQQVIISKKPLSEKNKRALYLTILNSEVTTREEGINKQQLIHNFLAHFPTTPAMFSDMIVNKLLPFQNWPTFIMLNNTLLTSHEVDTLIRETAKQKPPTPLNQKARVRIDHIMEVIAINGLVTTVAQVNMLFDDYFQPFTIFDGAWLDESRFLRPFTYAMFKTFFVHMQNYPIDLDIWLINKSGAPIMQNLTGQEVGCLYFWLEQQHIKRIADFCQGLVKIWLQKPDSQKFMQDNNMNLVNLLPNENIIKKIMLLQSKQKQASNSLY